jgi:hypothetical protein
MEEGNVNSDVEESEDDFNKEEEENEAADWQGWTFDERETLYKCMKRYGKHAIHQIAK